MVRFKCPQCEKSLKVNDELAGKRAKCKCGATFRVPSENGKVVEIHNRCSSCQQELQSGWIACPACGAKVDVIQKTTARSIGKTDSTVVSAGNAIVVAEQKVDNSPVEKNKNRIPTSAAEPMVQASDDAIVNAEINAASQGSVSGDQVRAINRSDAAGPMVQASGDAVVSAEIDASSNVTVSGDQVGGNKIHSQVNAHTIQQNIDNRESGLATLAKAMDPVGKRNQELEAEFRSAQSDDVALAALIRKHISGLESAGLGEMHEINSYFKIGQQAIELYSQRNAHDRNLLVHIDQLRNQLSSAHLNARKRIRNTYVLIGIGLAVGFVVLMIFNFLMAFLSGELGNQ